MSAPAREMTITVGLVRHLLETQTPQFAGEELAIVAEGWDNVLVRVGHAHVARLPRRAVAVPLIEHEQRWLPVLAPLLPVSVPAPVALGEPSSAFPHPWHVSPWLDGVRSSRARGGEDRGVDLARVFAALHVAAPADAPRNAVRAVPLAQRTDVVRERLARGGLTHLADVWESGRAATPWIGAATWVHGDPHPGNALIDPASGRLTALLDFGDLSAGDPACDLAAAWLHCDATGRAAFRATYDAITSVQDEGRWQRAAAWALSMASSVVVDAPGDADNEGWAREALAALACLLAWSPFSAAGLGQRHEPV